MWRDAESSGTDLGATLPHDQGCKIVERGSRVRHHPAIRVVRLLHVESLVHPNDDFLSTPELDYDGFRAALREDWGCLVLLSKPLGAHAARLRIRCNRSHLQRYAC
jgi:hypothetical protein